MQKSLNDLDWNNVRALYATAEKGSLSAAAKALGLTQPTLSRQITALEEQLGVTLFERVGKKLLQTQTCRDLLVHVEAMQEAARGLALAASGRTLEVAGPVSISATDVYAAYILPKILQVLRAKHPDITLTVIASNQLSDIRKREADIAIRHVRPKEPELIGKLLYETEAHFFASKAWVKRNGLPVDEKSFAAAPDWLGIDDTALYADYLQKIGVPVFAEQFRIASSNSVVLWELVKLGQGIGAMLKEVAETTPGLVRLMPNLAPIKVPLWLVTHRELHTSPRIRAVFDVLSEELKKVSI
jgi:DNA-binding transcriptional LysR family regulator